MSGYDAQSLTFLLQILKEQVTGYVNIKSGAKEEFRKLHDELLEFQAFIKDSEDISEKKELYKEKLRQIRELVYDVQDTIDTCFTKRAGAKKVNLVSRICQKLSISMEKEVRYLRDSRVKPMLDDIKSIFGKINVGDVENPLTKGEKFQAMPTQIVSVFKKNLLVDEASSQDEPNEKDDVVDFKEQETIIKYLLESKNVLDVISISGLPGLGKSTLAKSIIHDPEVAKEFPIRIWIDLSEKFDSREVFLNILTKVSNNNNVLPNSSLEEARKTVRAHLVKIKFLLVLDNVWTVEDWKAIESILPNGNNNSKVLITTRQGDVVESASTYGSREHKMVGLDSKRSWKLLQKKVFGGKGKCNPMLVPIGNAIADKCGGSPLIIGVIGGILKRLVYEKQIPDILLEWTKFYENVGNNLITDKDKSISNVVELSYRRLPYDHKVCFLYTGLFPDNHEIPASMLTQLWIAEGFIWPDDPIRNEEIAYNIMMDLINHNLLMAGKKNHDQVKSCRVHDTLRAFCKAKAVEENFFRVVKQVTNPSSEAETFRRLCLHSVISESTFATPHLRSFLCFFKSDNNLVTIPDSNFIRVLSYKHIRLREFPKLEKLILLKYISLSTDSLKTIPKEISQLLNLQTLIIETNSESIEVKANIWKMMQLQHIKSRAAIILLDDKKSRSEPHKNLKTLSRLSPKYFTATLSNRAINLKTLGIRGNLETLFETMYMENFMKLEELKLVNESIDYPLRRLPPSSDHFPPMLKRLTLSKTYLKWNIHMEKLASINTLEVLKLKDNAFGGTNWEPMDVRFKSLRFLLIEETELIDWKASKTQFPVLSCLVLKKCVKLHSIPVELAHAKYLEKLELEKVKESAAESAEEIKSKKEGSPLKLIVDQAQK